MIESGPDLGMVMIECVFSNLENLVHWVMSEKIGCAVNICME
jgi:hypothetical protein